MPDQESKQIGSGVASGGIGGVGAVNPACTDIAPWNVHLPTTSLVFETLGYQKCYLLLKYAQCREGESKCAVRLRKSDWPGQIERWDVGDNHPMPQRVTDRYHNKVFSVRKAR